MATIIDPLGTPSIVYNQSGTVLIEMDAAGDPNSGSGAAEIPHVSGHMIVIINRVSNSAAAATPPSTSEVGDILEVFCTSSGPISLWPCTGETIAGGAQVVVNADKGYRLIKTSSTNWSYIS